MPPRLLLICGAPRSGTTLLQAIACSGPDTNPLIGEAVSLAHLAGAYTRSREIQAQGDTTDYFADAEDLREFFRQPIVALLRRVWQRHDRPHCLVLKSPALTSCLPDLLDLLPQAQALVSVRDPRDGAASLRSIVRAAPRPTEFEQKLAQQPIARLGRYFCEHYTAVLTCRDDRVWERLRFVRYEGLVAQPEAAIEQLRTFTNLNLACNPNQPWQRSAINLRALPERYRAWWSGSGYGDRISATSVGRYQQQLSGEEIRAIERECGDWMQRFGYATG